jgi:spoIIIJ-associated protein
MDKEVKKIIKSVAIDIVSKMGIDSDVEIDEIEEENIVNVVCDIRAKNDSNLLIGQNGDNLQALQHIIRLIVRSQTEERINFVVDVNSYKKEKNDSIVSLAKEMAKKTVSEKKAVVLRPMTAYERRLVHMELSENKDVVTESIGDGDDRKIVIKAATGDLV